MIANSGSPVYAKGSKAPPWMREKDAVRRYWEVVKNLNPHYKKERENKRHRRKKQVKNNDYYELAKKYENLYKKLEKYKKEWLYNWENNKNKTIEYQTETHQIREKIIDFVYDWYILMTKKYNNKMAKKLHKLEPLACSLIDIRDLIKIRYNLMIDETFGDISEEKKKEIDELTIRYINSLWRNLEDYLNEHFKSTMLYLPPYSVIRSRKLTWFIEKNKKHGNNEIVFIGENGEKIKLFNSKERLIYTLSIETAKRIKEKWRKENPNQ